MILRAFIVVGAVHAAIENCNQNPFSNEHWKYAGNSWTNSDDSYFQLHENNINKIGDSYEFMKKCDPSDSNDPRCNVWRIVFPSNADKIGDFFHIKYTLADTNNPDVPTGFNDYFEFSHFETNGKSDCTDSSDRNCRQIHAIIKQVTENDVENRNLNYLATSGYFVHDFELECKDNSNKKYRYRTSQDDNFLDYYWNLNPTSPGFPFENKYSNIYNPLFDQQPYEQEFPECPEVDFESIEMFSSCSEANLNVFTDICGLGTNPFMSPTRIILTDPNNRNNTALTCTPCNRPVQDATDCCTVLTDLQFDTFTEANQFDLISCDGCSAVDYFIEKRVQFKSDFNYEQQYFYNIPLLGKNIGPWTDGQDTVREEGASMRLTIQDAPDQAPQFSKQEFLLTVEEGTGRNRLTTQNGDEFEVQSYDQDSLLKWDTEHVIIQVTDDDEITVCLDNDDGCMFAIDGNDCDANGFCSSNVKKNLNFFRECDPVTNPECTFDTPPNTEVSMIIATVEKVPADWFNACETIDSTGHCKGLPGCAQTNMRYQSRNSTEIRIQMIDINNNPPRFFNDETQKLIADESEAHLYCETCQDTNFGEIVEGSLENTGYTTMFIRLENTNEPSGIPIIAYDMDDNGNNNQNALFTVSMPEIILMKDDEVVNPCATGHESCGLCENNVPKKIFSFNNDEDHLKVNKQWANTYLEFNNIVQFSCVDEIRIKLKAEDDNDVTCKDQGQTNCKSTSLNLKLKIRETNKPPFCSKTTSGAGSQCRDLFETENDRTLGSIPEYSAPEVTFDDENKLIFKTSNERQYQWIYFCQLTEGGSSTDSANFEVVYGELSGTNHESMISAEGNIEFRLRKKEGVQLNMALAETYYFNLKVCSDDANLDASGIASCCGKTESQALITVGVTDENINAPNFDFYIGEDQVQNIPEGTLQEDDTGKSIVKLRATDLDFTVPNTRTCFEILDILGDQCKDTNFDELKASDYFSIKATKALDDSVKIWQAEIEQAAGTSFQNIQNCNDYKDGADHYNFKFALRACNYESDDDDSYEISECPQDGVKRICSDTIDAEQLIGEIGKGNSFLQIPVRDLNENTPVFSDTYDTPIYQVFEHIQSDLTPHREFELKTVKATDADRCWYGNGLIKFSNNENERYFNVAGGHEEIVEDNCSLQPEGVEPSAHVSLSGTETIYRENLVNANYDGQNYKLNIRAQDMPRGGSGNLAQTTILIEIKDINNYYPVFTDDSIENHQAKYPNSTFANYGRSQQIHEGSEEARSDVRPNIHFYICEAFDPDSKEYSTDINKYEIKNVIGCRDASCQEQIQEPGSFEIDEIATFDKDSEEIANQKDAPCERLVRVSVSRTESFEDGDQVMLDREIIPFYRLVIGVKDSKCDQASSFGNYNCLDTGNDILYPKDCVCDETADQTKCKDLLHICDHKCESGEYGQACYTEKWIDLQVLDMNDNAPQFVDAQRVAYIVKAGAQALQQIGENFELTDADLEQPATHMSVRLKGEQYLGCSTQSCQDSGPYFKVSDANNYDQINGKASFTITTDKQIPLYEESNFFSTVVLEIESYNPKELFAYPCDDEDDELVQKYANAKCYGKSDKGVTCDSGSCEGHVYNTEFIQVTVIDDDHSGNATSTSLNWGNDKITKFENDMNDVFEMYFHGENGDRTQAFPHFEGFHFETKVYELKGNYTQPDSDEGVPELNSYLISWYVNCIKPAVKNDNSYEASTDTVMLMDTANMTQAMLDRQIAAVIWDSAEYGISCMMDCEVLCEDCGGIEEKDLWVIIVSLGGAIIALIIIFSCAIHYLKKKYRNKLAAVSAYHDTEGYDEYELKEKMGAEDFDKMQAYKIANGQVNANPLVDKDGMINLAMDYESEQESEGSDVDDESIESYNESDGEIKEVFVDPIAPQPRDMRPTLANFLITGGESGQKSNPLAGMADADQFASDM